MASFMDCLSKSYVNIISSRNFYRVCLQTVYHELTDFNMYWFLINIWRVDQENPEFAKCISMSKPFTFTKYKMRRCYRCYTPICYNCHDYQSSIFRYHKSVYRLLVIGAAITNRDRFITIRVILPNQCTAIANELFQKNQLVNLNLLSHCLVWLGVTDKDLNALQDCIASIIQSF